MKVISTLCQYLFLFVCLQTSISISANEKSDSESTLNQALIDLKKEVIALNRDLFILEEDLLFPASSQLAVFVSVDIGRFLQIDSLEIKLNNQTIASHLYTERQRQALVKGGIQRVYLGNLKTGEHHLTAVVTGLGPNQRLIKRAIEHDFSKAETAVMLELAVIDSETKQQAIFQVQQWQND